MAWGWSPPDVSGRQHGQDEGPLASELLSHLPTESRGNWLRFGAEALCLDDFAAVTGWYARCDSNTRPLAPEASALSAELRAHLRECTPCDGLSVRRAGAAPGRGRSSRAVWSDHPPWTIPALANRGTGWRDPGRRRETGSPGRPGGRSAGVDGRRRFVRSGSTAGRRHPAGQGLLDPRAVGRHAGERAATHPSSRPPYARPVGGRLHGASSCSGPAVVPLVVDALHGPVDCRPPLHEAHRSRRGDGAERPPVS